MPDSNAIKTRLRQALRQRRHALDPHQQSAAAVAVVTHMQQLPGWSSTSRIALYLGCDGEVDTLPLSEACRSRGMALYLPVMGPDRRLAFALWETGAPLYANSIGIKEPAAGAARCDPGELDIVVMPLVGWDRRGGRLGMGGGYYDRSLAGVSGPLLVGLAHTTQEIPQVPCEPWDIALDYVVTEAQVYRCEQLNQAGLNRG